MNNKHVVLGCGIFFLLLYFLSGCGCGDKAARMDARGAKGSAATASPGKPGFAEGGFDELWVIERPKSEKSAKPDDLPGSGALTTTVKDKEVPVPLKHTEVKADVSGYIATVSVTQKFHNPFSEKIEAKYVFPLPTNAAVNEFIMTIGERRIRGIIREREEAEKIYLAARNQGYVASLLTQERPNIFTQSVANIEPGKEIDIDIKYFHTLAYVDGWYEFVFPMVVGPRFNPPDTTDGVGAVARGAAGESGQKTEVQYLKPGERSGHDIAVNVDIAAGVDIDAVACPSHAVDTLRVNDSHYTVALSKQDAIPNKDFVLRYKVAGKTIKANFITHQDRRGGFFTLMLYPPEDMSKTLRRPLEMVFVLDCSGSMDGAPIAKAKEAARRAIKRLGADDTFQIINFSNDASSLGKSPVPATPENVRRGLKYIDGLQTEGGTMMIAGIKAALDFPHDPRRFRLVSFLTDGYIGNENEIFREVDKRLGASRLFSFGVGSSVNRYLLDGLARMGRGAVAYVGLDESAGDMVDKFYERIAHAAMTDITVDWGGLEVSDVYPKRIPDLFVGRPVILTGRYKGDGEATVRVKGRVGEGEKEIALKINASEDQAAHSGVPLVWARAKIADLSDQAVRDGEKEYLGQIKSVAIEYGLMSAYTAFVAVDSLTKTSGDHGTTVVQPVLVPEGVKYETTVKE
jgi:Ca-activated chloride channel homolog